MKKTLGSLVVMVAVGTSPLVASAATDTQSTTINATVGAAISMTTSATVGISVTPTASGSASSASDTVTVSTSNSGGYNLSMSNTDTSLSLVKGGDSIVSHTGTFGAPTTLGNNSWGYRIDSVGSFGAGPTSAETNQANLAGTWSGIPSSAAPQLLKTTATTTSADVTTVYYGVKVDTTKPSGVYTDSVTYTAVTN